MRRRRAGRMLGHADAGDGHDSAQRKADPFLPGETLQVGPGRRRAADASSPFSALKASAAQVLAAEGEARAAAEGARTAWSWERSASTCALSGWEASKGADQPLERFVCGAAAWGERRASAKAPVERPPAARLRWRQAEQESSGAPCVPDRVAWRAAGEAEPRLELNAAPMRPKGAPPGSRLAPSRLGPGPGSRRRRPHISGKTGGRKDDGRSQQDRRRLQGQPLEVAPFMP